MQLLFLLSFSALVSFFQGDFLVPDLPQAPPQKNADASLCLGVKVRIKVYLQGPYASAGLMNDNLRTRNGTVPDGSQSWIPTTQPYSSLSGFTHTGTETCNASVFATPTNAGDAIVDWVFIELRDKTTPSTIIETRAALLQKDGDVVETDGSNLDISFSNAISCGDYHIAVRHRNHLGARTNTVVPLGATSPGTTVDFTSTAFPNVYGTNALQTLTDGNKALYAGNVTQENVVSLGSMTTVSTLRYSGNGINNDRLPILSRVGTTNILATVNGYYSEDTNLNGVVVYSGNGSDRLIILSNVGTTNILATVTEQL